MEKSDTMNMPALVSICIPAYNCEKYIRHTLNCMCAQTYQHIEIIVVNDGSADATGAIISSIEDARLKFINVINGGAAKARNIAYKHAHGQYIIFFDADDYVEPDFVEKQLNKIDKRTDVVVLSAWGRFYDDIATFQRVELPKNDMTFADWVEYYWYNCNPMTTPGRAIIPKNMIEEVGLWNETLSLNDDLEFFTRIFLKADRIIFNHDTFFHYRSGISGLSAKTGYDGYQSLYDSIYLSVKCAFEKLEHEPLLLKSYANMWQSFIYTVYPDEKGLVKLAQQHINELTPPDLKYETGGITKLLTILLGWKTAKRLKVILKNGLA